MVGTNAFFLNRNHICESHLLFGNMNLISLTDADKDSLPWRAFFRSDIPYFALRLEKTHTII